MLRVRAELEERGLDSPLQLGKYTDPANNCKGSTVLPPFDKSY